jgi:hypothetical protein
MRRLIRDEEFRLRRGKQAERSMRMFLEKAEKACFVDELLEFYLDRVLLCPWTAERRSSLSGYDCFRKQ